MGGEAREAHSLVRRLRASARSRSHKSVAWNFFSFLMHAMPAKVVLAIALMVALSFTEGIGLLLLLPLLQLVGFDTQQTTVGSITRFTGSLFTAVGMPITLVTVLAIYVVIMSTYALLTRWQNIMSWDVTYDLQALLRERLYNAIVNTTWLFFSRNQASTFSHALTAEIERVGTGTQQLMQLLVSVMVVIVYLFVAWQLSAFVTAAVIGCGIVLFFVLKSKASLARARGKSLSIGMRGLYGAVAQHLDGMKTVKSYGAQRQNAALFSQYNERVAAAYKGYWRNWSDTRCIFDIGSVLILSAALVVLMEVLHLPGAVALVLLFLFFRIIPRFLAMQQGYHSFVNMLPSFTNVSDLKARCEGAAEREIDDPENIRLQQSIEFRTVSFAYTDAGSAALKQINVTVHAGETTAIVGRSGAGKSTLADLVMGLITPREGEVLVDNVPLTAERLYAWRNQIGYVAQDTFLFNDTVRANLTWAHPTATEDELYEALRTAAAEDFVTQLPDGIDTVLGDRGVRLSGGERQRLALARALLRQPALLLLDEATSSLDSENERRIQDAIDALRGDMTIVQITHRLSTIRNADVIHVIDNGHIVESGDWPTLIARDGRFVELSRAQGLL
ncbi:MAG: ABC transporter ATP-binding protein [Halobacteriota archaeon]